MNHHSDRMIHESSLPFRDEPIRNLAVYCSDGRFGDHVDELLHKRLEVGQFDRLVVPGGPAVLVEQAPCFFEMQGLTRQLQFLVEAHPIRRVLLIGHEGCAFYLHHLHVPAQEVAARQRRDLEEAVGRVRQISAGLSVHAIFAHAEEARVRFELLDF